MHTLIAAPSSTKNNKGGVPEALCNGSPVRDSLGWHLCACRMDAVAMVAAYGDGSAGQVAAAKRWDCFRGGKGGTFHTLSKCSPFYTFFCVYNCLFFSKIMQI